MIAVFYFKNIHIGVCMISKRLVLLLSVLVLIIGLAAAVYAEDRDDPWSVHGHEYYGRKLIEQMPDSTAMLFAYDSLAAGIEDAALSIVVYNGTDCLSSAQWKIVLDLYQRDYSQHFWVESYNVISNAATILEIQPVYSFDGADLSAARAHFDLAVNEILAGITEDMSEFEKELYFHDVLAARILYSESTTHCHNAYGAIVEGYATCDGYAEAFQYLLHREGIQSFVAKGYSYNFKTQSYGVHAWNYVCIDGVFYQADLTWDDLDADHISYEYLNLDDAEMGEYHYASAVSYTVPVCNSLEANYHYRMGTRLDSYTVSGFAGLLKEHDYSVKVYIPGDINKFWSWFNSNYMKIATSAGIKPGYDVAYSYLYREFSISYVLKNATAPVATVEYNGKHTSYTTVAAAIKNAESGYVKLLSDCSENLTISRDLYIDLNGFDMTGAVVVLDGATLYGMDSSTDDYHCQDGYGVITNLSGSFMPHFKTSVTGVIKRYLAVNENGTVSFHRFFLGVVYVSIQPGSTGLGFKAIFAGDEKVVEQLDADQAYGYTLGLEGGNEISLYNDRAHFVSGRKVSMLIHNYDIENFGETKLYASVMLKLRDGTVIQSAQVSTSMRMLLEDLNTHISILNTAQLIALREMLLSHPVVKLWKTDKFYI